MAIKAKPGAFFTLLSAQFFVPMLVAVLSETFRSTDLLTVTVQALPGRFRNHDCITDFQFVNYVVHQRTVAGFTRQVQMTGTQFHRLPMAGMAGFVTAVAHGKFG